MYITMVRLILLLLIFLTTKPAFSEPAHEVTLRAGRQDTIARIVLESDDIMIMNLSASTSLPFVKVDFPFPFVFIKPSSFEYPVIKREKGLDITLLEAESVRTYKLSGPPRLVIEFKTSRPAAPKPPETPPATGHGQPVLPDSPAREAVPEGHVLRAVVIDPGHGGFDYGIIQNTVREKDITLALSRDLGTALSSKLQTVFTRKADQSLSIMERSQAAARKKLFFFISIHLTLADQFVIYTAQPDDTTGDPAEERYNIASHQKKHAAESMKTAQRISDMLKKEFQRRTVIRQLPVPVLASADTPAVVVEIPVALRPADQKIRERLASALMKGILGHEE